MTRTNFHTHTYRCGHAVGDERAMVESAIKNKIEILGFSCHVPLPRYRLHILKGIPYSVVSFKALTVALVTLLTNGPAMRMPYLMRGIHLKNVKDLTEKYQDKITIYQGFEAEYFEEYLKYYQELFDTNTVDYLILGHHFHRYNINNLYYGRPIITSKDIVMYKEEMLKALDTNLFSYVAHPDLFMIGKKSWDQQCEEATREICNKAKEMDIPLEINGGGIRRGLREVDGELVYSFPNTHFWKVVSEIGNKVVIGIDAHRPDDFNDEIYEQLHKFASIHKLNLVDTFEFKKGNKRV